MKIVAVSLLALVLAACGSQGGDQSTEPTSSTITVYVANQAGVPLEGIHVGAEQSIGTEVRELAVKTVTDANGSATITLPVNITASISLANAAEPADLPSDVPSETRYQNALIVPSENVTLFYQYPQTLACATVDPSQPSSCPALPVPTSSPSSSPSQ